MFDRRLNRLQAGVPVREHLLDGLRERRRAAVLDCVSQAAALTPGGPPPSRPPGARGRRPSRGGQLRARLGASLRSPRPPSPRADASAPPGSRLAAAGFGPAWTAPAAPPTATGTRPRPAPPASG